MSDRGIAFRIEEPWTATAIQRSASARRLFDSENGLVFQTLATAQALLEDPAAAETRAGALLRANSADPIAKFLLGGALARQGRNEAARTVLEPLTTSQPQMGPAWRELGFVLEKLGDREAATAALLKALDFNYVDEDVLVALGNLLSLEEVPGGPSSLLTGFRHAAALVAQRKFEDALGEFEKLVAANPTNMLLKALKVIALTGAGRTEAAIVEYQSFIEACDWPGLWLEYARALRLMRDPRAAPALKRAIRILPSFVEAYIFYASVKPFPWDEEMIASARAQLSRPDLAAEDRAQLHSALGKAYEDLENYAESFANYRRCNEILRGDGNSSAQASANFVHRMITIFSPVFLRRGTGSGSPVRGPIFIVGMKRSGSTLVEQILSRHSAIEPLGELEALTEVIGRRRGYPQILKQLGPEAFRAMGDEYISLAGRQRKLGKPFFTDKLPHNFGRIGLIHLILPNAKIIDVRRHPLDCGLSCYKHYFPGAQISLSLGDFASGYVDYVRLMAHFDKALPGKVHRLFYEDLVGNLEHEVRRLLDYLGVPFEEDCLRFHEEARYVDTPSADQVRTPLYNSAVDYWRHFEPWLGPMKDKLGYLLHTYPEVPGFFDDVRVRLRNPLSLGETGRHFVFIRGLRQLPVATI